MRESGHKPLGDLSSVSSTISPIWKIRRGLNHFCLFCKAGRYSFTPLRQNTSDKYWTCLHLRLVYMSSLAKIPDGNDWPNRKRKTWLGVRGRRLMQCSHGPPWWNLHGGLNANCTFLLKKEIGDFSLIPFFDRAVKLAFSRRCRILSVPEILFLEQTAWNCLETNRYPDCGPLLCEQHLPPGRCIARRNA